MLWSVADRVVSCDLLTQQHGGPGGTAPTPPLPLPLLLGQWSCIHHCSDFTLRKFQSGKELSNKFHSDREILNIKEKFTFLFCNT